MDGHFILVCFPDLFLDVSISNVVITTGDDPYWEAVDLWYWVKSFKGHFILEHC